MTTGPRGNAFRDQPRKHHGYRAKATSSPSLERRMTFALEVARCYDQRHEDAAVILHLMNAEASGPEDMRYNTLARDLVRSLLKRARPTFQPQVQSIARRIGLLE